MTLVKRPSDSTFTVVNWKKHRKKILLKCCINVTGSTWERIELQTPGTRVLILKISAKGNCHWPRALISVGTHATGRHKWCASPGGWFCHINSSTKLIKWGWKWSCTEVNSILLCFRPYWRMSHEEYPQNAQHATSKEPSQKSTVSSMFLSCSILIVACRKCKNATSTWCSNFKLNGKIVFANLMCNVCFVFLSVESVNFQPPLVTETQSEQVSTSTFSVFTLLLKI